MINKTKIALAAAIIAALATPALAQGLVPNYNPRQAPSHRMKAPPHTTRTPRFIEERNAAVSGDFRTSNVSPTSREFMVQTLGN